MDLKLCKKCQEIFNKSSNLAEIPYCDECWKKVQDYLRFIDIIEIKNKISKDIYIKYLENIIKILLK